MNNKNECIDAVITWVDGSDSNWAQKKEKYSQLAKSSESNHQARYRNWNTFQYVFRSIENNMPWINHIYLVTDNQIPYFLNLNSNKITIVDHKDIIPQEYLPTFNANTIELNLHRIPGLSEQFIFFNDDTFIVNPMVPNDFFVDGLPCDFGILNVHCEKKSLMIHSIANNDISIINEYFDIKEVLKQKISNWYNVKYGLKYNLQNKILFSCPRFPGIKQFHIPTSLLKSTYIELWDKEYDTLHETCMNKFRSKTDVNQWLIREWQLAKNEFIPSSLFKNIKLIDFESKDELDVLNDFLHLIHNSKMKILCVNDGDTIKNFNYIQETVLKALDKRFPEKSSFEL